MIVQGHHHPNVLVLDSQGPSFRSINCRILLVLLLVLAILLLLIALHEKDSALLVIVGVSKAVSSTHHQFINTEMVQGEQTKPAFEDVDNQEVEDHLEDENSTYWLNSSAAAELPNTDSDELLAQFLNDNDFPDETLPQEEPSAPRSMPELAYNEVNSIGRYLIYNPSGGMTNQEMELTNMLMMAHISKRTLYLPMVGRHSDLFKGYNSLEFEDLFPADRIFDIPLMNQFAKIAPLNITVHGIVARFIKIRGPHTVRVVSEMPENFDEFLRRESRSPIPLVFYQVHHMYHHWFPRDAM